MKGIFEKVEAKSVNTKRGLATSFSVHISGKKYSLGFNDKLVTHLKVGDPVNFEVSVNAAGYSNIDSIEKDLSVQLAAPNMALSPSSMQATQSNNQDDIKQEQIVRQSSVKVAAELVISYANAPLTKKNWNAVQRLEKTIAFADHIVRFIQTGKVEVLDQDVVTKLKEAVEGEE